MGLSAPRALCGVLLLCLAQVVTSQQSCAAGNTDCDGAGAGTTCCACAAGKYKTTVGTATCTDCPQSQTSPSGSSLVSACNCGAGSYFSGSPYVTGIQQSYPVANISNFACVACYDEAYSHITSSSNIDTCKTAAGSTGWILMGSRSSTAATNFALLASIKGSNFVTSASTTVAYLSNGAYWYYYLTKSVGFAASSAINLARPDTSLTDCANRLSWLLNGLNGGYRSGCTLNLQTDATWRKIMYSCQNFESCAACPAGTSSPAGSDDVADCVESGCPAGSTGPNAQSCALCEAGKYKPAEGSEECTACGAGTYSAATGASAAGACVACPANSQPATTTAASSCLCNAGYETSLDGSGVIVACSACPTGKYKAAAGSASGCSLCESDLSFSTGAFDSASQYCVCRPGYVLDAGACRACQKGMYKENQGNSTLGCASLLDGCCPCGQFQTTASAGSSVALTDCVCLHGHGVADPNNFACMPCPHGTYKEGTDRQACAACPAGTSTGEVGAFEARECVSRAGYFMVFDAGGLGTAHACASGTYSDHLNATACEPCFEGATSPPASESIAACACEPPFAPSGAALDCTCAAGFALA